MFLACCLNNISGRAAEIDSLDIQQDCLICHQPSPQQRGPSFLEIARRYSDDASQYYLNLVTVDALEQLPTEQTSQVILARIGKKLHTRVFDSQGKMVVDQSKDQIDASFSALLGNFQKASSGKQKVPNALARQQKLKQQLLQNVFESTGYLKSWERARLIDVVKHGGKGNWKHGTPMPGFALRLTDTEIRQLVDRILATTELKVMKQGIGTGTINVSPGGINCNSVCRTIFSQSETVTLTATADVGSRFVRWEGDVAGFSHTTQVTMDQDRSVRAWFEPDSNNSDTAIPELTDFTPEGINAYLTANPQVTTAAHFLYALPEDRGFKKNWILMSRSESLQTGTAAHPRILLPSADSQFVFSISTTPHLSFPGSHPNAVEYMQWDGAQKNFRFHEIVLTDIPAISVTVGNGQTGDERPTFAARRRGVSTDDRKCFQCHSTQNVLNDSNHPGTTGTTPGTVKSKTKPNWDTYDSWAGMLPLNRDRLYKGSIEVAAIRKIFNPWTWSDNEPVREIIEQLMLQSDSVSSPDIITRHQGGTYDGLLEFEFDENEFPVLKEPTPETDPNVPYAPEEINYSFDSRVGTGATTTVIRHGLRTKLYDPTSPNDSEGRGVEFFDILGGFDGQEFPQHPLVKMPFNAQRIVDELIDHRHYPSGIDIRPIALAISKDLFTIDGNSDTVTSSPAHQLDLSFFETRHGMTVNALYENTLRRAQSLPRRKADFQRFNLNRQGDKYLAILPGGDATGLIKEYGVGTVLGTDDGIDRLRQEVFRRPIDIPDTEDQTVIGGFYVDRETHGTPTPTESTSNTDSMTLFRFFLEPLGVSVDKWSMGVRGRSRTYTFADIFLDYKNTFKALLKQSLLNDPFPGLTDPDDETKLIVAVNRSLSTLPPVDAIPTFVEIQRIFNKACIECHGGLNYPPYSNYFGSMDLSEDERPVAPEVRLSRSHRWATRRANAIQGRINRSELTQGHMPFLGPPLSKVDRESFRRWKEGGQPGTSGATHLRTVDGVDFDFHAAGEFVLLRDLDLEVQVRQTPVETTLPPAPNDESRLTSWISVNTAVAIRVDSHRLTLQPLIKEGGTHDPQELQLRMDGKLIEKINQPIPLASGGRLLSTLVPGGLQVETAGGTVLVIIPHWWAHQKLWFLNVSGRRVRATQGLLGKMAPQSWLPRLADGRSLGARPADKESQYQALYHKLADSWRINDDDSLFDYLEGTSTKTFTNKEWPSADLSLIPELNAIDPQSTLSQAEAKDLCRGIADASRQAKAIQDVRLTGEPAFAQIYALTEKIVKNSPPTPPVLNSPLDDAKGLRRSIEFRWKASVDAEKDPIQYRLHVWPVDELPNNNDAVLVRRSTSSDQSKVLTQLVPGQAYFWKIIAEDGKGWSQESETWRFEVGSK